MTREDAGRIVAMAYLRLRKSCAVIACAVAALCGVATLTQAFLAPAGSASPPAAVPATRALRGQGGLAAAGAQGQLTSTGFAGALAVGLVAGLARHRFGVARRAGGGDIEDLVPFELRGFSLALIFSAVGFLLLVYSFYDYYTSFGSGAAVSGVTFVYAVPILVLGLALYYAELLPVEVETMPGAEGLFDRKATPTLKKIVKDVTRHRYGDDAHLDSSLRTLGLYVKGGKYPKLLKIIESLADGGELEFTMLFESKDVPYKTWSATGKPAQFDRFFGPGVWSRVSKYSSEDKIAALHLTTGSKPEGAAAEAASTAAEPVAAAAIPAASAGLRMASAGASALAGGRTPESRRPRVGRAARGGASGSVEEMVESLVSENHVVVFSKSWCPYCNQAKKALTDQGAKFLAVEIDEREEENEIQNYMQTVTGARTVPRIFIGGKFVGGCDDVLGMSSSGELEKLLEKA